MNSPGRPDESVKRLLDGLEQKRDDEVAVVSALKGRAISRSATSIHLATAAGIMAVPIANIKEVVTLTDARSDLVRVIVKNPKDVRQLLAVRSARPTGGGSGGGGGGGAVAMMEDGDRIPTDRYPEKTYVGVGTYVTTDSDTVTGGEGNADATDDREDHGGSADDTFE